MEKLAEIAKKQPVIVPAVIAVGLIWAYHNGHLNFLFSAPSKAGQPKTAAN